MSIISARSRRLVPAPVRALAGFQMLALPARALRLAALALPLAALMPANPAFAQFSESYKFLDSVRKKEGDKINEALQVPGTQIVNTRDVTTGDSALHIVTARRDLLWMQYLVGKGANVNIHNNKGETPLVIAANLGFLEGVDFLISVGARVDEPNNTGETPLISAVHVRNMALVRSLLKAGANPDHPDNSGRSARDYAVLDKNTAMSEELDAAAAKKKTQDKGAQTYGPTF